MQGENYKFRLTIAIIWLFLIYTFLPFGPDFFNFLSKQLGLSFVKRLLAFLSVLGALLVYLPFIKKFKDNRLLPYIIATVTLLIACVTNIVCLNIPATALHIPEYMILSTLLFRAFITKYTPKKSYILTAIIAVLAGIIDERVIQYLLPMRVYDFSDILLNAAGGILGIILISAYRLQV